jgi:hypothetical protein
MPSACATLWGILEKPRYLYFLVKNWLIIINNIYYNIYRYGGKKYLHKKPFHLEPIKYEPIVMMDIKDKNKKIVLPIKTFHLKPFKQ